MAKQLGYLTRKAVRRAIRLSRARTLAEAEKGAGAEAPAQVDREVTQTAETVRDGSASAGEVSRAPSTMDRGTTAARATGVPTFTVIEGGRREARGEEGPNLPASVLRSYGRDHRARKLLKLVWVR